MCLTQLMPFLRDPYVIRAQIARHAQPLQIAYNSRKSRDLFVIHTQSFRLACVIVISSNSNNNNNNNHHHNNDNDNNNHDIDQLSNKEGVEREPGKITDVLCHYLTSIVPKSVI